jgi:FdhD protein
MRATPQTQRCQVLRWQLGSKARRARDELAAEEPLQIQVDTRPVVVTMRTPGHDEELAAGFLLSEGLIRGPDDLIKITPHLRNKAGNVLDVFLAPEVTVDFTQLTRNVFASSSCGLCGKASIEAVHRHFPRLKKTFKVAARTILRLPGRLRHGQVGFERTGGLHAAALFDSEGRLIVLREDVGRHNAVDKVLGYGLLNRLLPFERRILMVSGRASFEILQKALAARIPMVAAVSAPSSLAVQFARQSGQTLVGFLRGDRMNVYSRPEQVGLPDRLQGVVRRKRFA